jgi:hypothetical protein
MRIDPSKDLIEHHSKEYPMEVGAPVFAPVAVLEEKDRSLNVAKIHAKQEYERIMEQVDVLRKQAESLMRRLDVTHIVHATDCTFNPLFNTPYYIYHHIHKEKNVMMHMGPHEWSSGTPDHLQFVVAVRKKGDSTWEEVVDE